MLLRNVVARTGETLGPVKHGRPRLPAVLISDGTQALLREIFQK